jgi:ubiquinone/menaquinone biosynthesis C-methylase UbiE
MSSNKASWEEADFTTIAAFMRQSGEEVVRSLGITPPLSVLDLGCGDGTTAIPLARHGADVLGIDIARNLVAAGRRRAEEAGLHRLQFQEGDACSLEGVRDGSFDLTLSMFGAMFAPRPFNAAREMVRVTRPGGRIVMGNWIPDDPTFIVQLRNLAASLLPPPPDGAISPLEWGVEGHVLERFGRAGVSRENISLKRETYWFTSRDKTPEDFAEVFTRFYEPAFESARLRDKIGEFYDRLLELTKAQNRITDGSTHIPANFLRVTVSLAN